MAHFYVQAFKTGVLQSALANCMLHALSVRRRNAACCRGSALIHQFTRAPERTK